MSIAYELGPLLSRRAPLLCQRTTNEAANRFFQAKCQFHFHTIAMCRLCNVKPPQRSTATGKQERSMKTYNAQSNTIRAKHCTASMAVAPAPKAPKASKPRATATSYQLRAQSSTWIVCKSIRAQHVRKYPQGDVKPKRASPWIYRAPFCSCFALKGIGMLKYVAAVLCAQPL